MGVTFVVPGGVWIGQWVVRAHDGASPDIFFAERVGDVPVETSMDSR